MSGKEQGKDDMGGQSPAMDPQALQKMVERQLDLNAGNKKDTKDKYAFWETQPVAQFGAKGGVPQDGPIDPPKTINDVRAEPIKLPAPFEWCDCDLRDEAVTQQVYDLLASNYVEDDDNMFRFDYSPEFLRWAMMPPGWRTDWLLGVRDARTQKLLSFISAIPQRMRVREHSVPMVEINFLCVHKKLRSRRLAPVLIKEITRRVNRTGVWQAVYTAGVVIPKPVAVCRYWHRSLNPKKLIEVGFSRLARNMTMARTVKLYRLPERPQIPGWRKMEARDLAQVGDLLRAHLDRYALRAQITDEELEHWMMPRDGVVYTYVVEREGGRITDMGSFYSLPSQVLGHAHHTDVRAAFSFYSVATEASMRDVMNDCLTQAKLEGFDVFNALDLMDNADFLKDLKFGIGDGFLHYYLYNWGGAGGQGDEAPLKPNDVGLIML
ncbi:unnamed protein product [Pedinophyceae sp. YPF-701]|nr:unnamed protein product [Pedinophyceae sp. YPF-701]